MSKIRVTNIQRLCVNDGPGVRTVVFLKGCTLQCPWCCNPEAIHINGYQVFDKGICAYPEKKRYCNTCERFGGERKLSDCPVHAFGATESQYTPDEILRVLLKDKMTYNNGGGVTFSGGEPLLQIQAILPVLQELRARHIHVAFETALFVPAEYIIQAMPYADYWLVDLKFQFGYVENKEFGILENVIDKNLSLLQDNVNADSIHYRMVLMHEAMKNSESIVRKLYLSRVEDVELLEYHSLAENKYRQLMLEPIKFSAPTEDDLREIGGLLKNKNIHYTYTRL